MFERLSTWLRRISTGWVTLAALVVFLLFTALVLPRQSSEAAATSADVGTPDLSLYYSVDDLYRMAEAYGEDGRTAYVRARFTFDVLWPLIYTAFLVTAISWLFGRGFGSDTPWQRANLAPVLAALFDLLENLSTSLVMLRYPSRTAVIDSLAPVFTFVKWILVGGSFLLLLLGIAIAGWQWIRRRGGGETDNDG
jgi:hypothetical protein